MKDETTAVNYRKLPGYPWLPCPICRGTEGCDHVVPERWRASLVAHAETAIQRVLLDLTNETGLAIDCVNIDTRPFSNLKPEIFPEKD